MTAIIEALTALEAPVRLRFPCCNRQLTLHTSHTATDVRGRVCPRCRKVWQIILRPLRTNRDMVIRQVDWVEVV